MPIFEKIIRYTDGGDASSVLHTVTAGKKEDALR
jgi:hypothetical protein